MKKVFNIILAIATIISASSCTKIIDLDLNESNPKIVIDGSINFYDSLQHDVHVNLSRTGSYSSSNEFSKIDNADLYIKSPDGSIYSLVGSGNGDYFNSEFIPGNSFDKFELYGDIDGVEISATSSFPNRVNIDSIGAIVLPFGPPNPDLLLTPIISFTDIPNEKNYYRFRLIVNHDNVSELFFQGDEGQDGKQMIYTFFRSRVAKNDTITIQLLSIDKESYDYYTVLNQNIGGGGFSAAPGNPNTNIQGNAIGIFSAQYVSEKTIIAK